MAPLVSRTAALLLCLCACMAAAAASGLSKYNIDATNITTCGVSSGACMATQLHVSWSSLITGMGSIAGLPYWCARDNVASALLCVEDPSAVRVSELLRATTFAEDTLSIDDTKNMAEDKVWLFSGTLDSVVNPQSSMQMEPYYEHYIKSPSHIMTVYNVPAEHAWITQDWGNPCNVTAEPYLSHCDFDAAGSLLSFFYGPLKNKTSSLSMNLMSFNQELYTPLKIWPPLISMNSKGYVYVPTACKNGQRCMLHIAFHGCLQGVSSVGLDFVQHNGLNEWAEANNIIVLYPQALKNLVNPQGCWDWWGYTGTAYATKLGPQIATVKAMIDALTG